MIALCAILTMLAVFIASIRLFLGPTLQDRALAANSISTKIMLHIVLIAFLFEAPANILDIALLYALLAFTATLAILKFFRARVLRFDEENS